MTSQATQLASAEQEASADGATAPDTQAAAAPRPAAPSLSAGMAFMMAAAAGLVVANLYYAQPLAGPIAAAIGLPENLTGLIVTLTQIGYGLGLLFAVPLGDLVENRRLIVIMIGATVVGLLAAGLSSTPTPFLIAALAIGVASTAVQMIVPFAASLAPEESRGRVVGNVMSGLMLGIMLARPAASFIARLSSWHVVFFLSAAIMVVVAITLAVRLPKRVPQTKLSYAGLIASLGTLYMTQPVLRRRAFYQFCQFAAFSLFWTVTPLVLAGPGFNLTQGGIAIFALVGVAGAIASPIAGRLADRGWSRPATAFGILSVAVGFLITHIAPEGSTLALILFGAAAVVVDFGVSMTLVTSQRAIFALGADLRARLNGLFMATFFVGGALASAIGAWAFAEGGWLAASMIGLALPIVGFLYFLTEKR
jgi:predicted MFS family arabinose efflux permease